MKTLYFECNMGAAGDMLMAALLELHPGPADFLRRLNNIGIPDVVVSAEPSVKCGIRGTHVKVTVGGQEEGSLSEHGHSYEHSHSREHSHSHDHNRRSHEHNEHERSHDHNQHVHSHDHEHSHAHNHSNEQKHSHDHNHNSFHDIEHLIGHLRVSGAVKENALAVYNLVAEAESHVHGVPVNQIHFHEVGEMDALADIVGVCMLIEELAPEQIAATPVNVGSGFVHCAHGILPVPAPATARILQGVPIYSDNIVSGELCTPTGAALLKYFAKDFRKMPAITVSKIGYGMGKKDFEKANCVRAFIGGADGALHEEVVELICNLDDMTPEAVAFAQQLLLGEGALDVYTAPIGMKKGRAGLSFTCMCRTEDKDKMLFLIFKHTTTLGIREYTSRRYALKKEHTEVETEYGKVRVKTSRGFGITKTKPEYEDIAKIAKNEDMSVREVLNILNGITC